MLPISRVPFTLVVVLAMVASARGESAGRVVLELWPDGAPGATGRDEGDVPRWMLTRADSPQPTAGIVILPGGGYRGHAIDHEGHAFADWFRSLGVTSAICTYRVRGRGNDGAGYGYPAPMLDAQRAIRLMRAKAEEWNVDPDRIGVIGFSAGGHLASTVSTRFAEPDLASADPVERVSSRPDFAILAYPVIAFGQPHTHGGSQRNLLGEDADEALVASLSAERQVSPRTPPTFLFHTGEDQVVSVRNAVDYYLACHRHGVPAEMHLFHRGRHGLGLAAGEPGADRWPALCESWLRRQGVVTKSGPNPASRENEP